MRSPFVCALFLLLLAYCGVTLTLSSSASGESSLDRIILEESDSIFLPHHPTPPSPSSTPTYDKYVDDTPQVCPELILTDPSKPEPPLNYTFLLPPNLKPDFQGSWYMIDVIHSNSEVWYYKHIICKYATCSKYGCPTITILSNGTFNNPLQPKGDWGTYLRINNTLICAPNDHDVNKCPFV